MKRSVVARYFSAREFTHKSKEDNRYIKFHAQCPKHVLAKTCTCSPSEDLCPLKQCYYVEVSPERWCVTKQRSSILKWVHVGFFVRNEKYNICNMNKTVYLPCWTQLLMVTFMPYFHVMTCPKLSAVPLTSQKHYTITICPKLSAVLWPLKSITPKGWFFYIKTARPIVLFFSLYLMYHPTSVVFLILRIQEETYWNSFVVGFSEQCNTVQNTKTALRIYKQPIFKQRSSQAKKIITKKPH